MLKEESSCTGKGVGRVKRRKSSSVHACKYAHTDRYTGTHADADTRTDTRTDTQDTHTHTHTQTQTHAQIHPPRVLANLDRVLWEERKPLQAIAAVRRLQFTRCRHTHGHARAFAAVADRTRQWVGGWR